MPTAQNVARVALCHKYRAEYDVLYAEIIKTMPRDVHSRVRSAMTIVRIRTRLARKYRVEYKKLFEEAKQKGYKTR